MIRPRDARHPVFTLTQDDATVLVRIRVPYVRVGAMETHVDGRDLLYRKPYLLRLRLPRACVTTKRPPRPCTTRKTMALSLCICPRRSPVSTSKGSTC